MASFHFAGEVIEPLAACGVNGMSACEALPSPDREIDIDRVELDTAAAPADPLGRNQRGAAAKKRVQHKRASGRAIEQRIGDESNGLWCWMSGQQVTLLASAPEMAGAGVLPDIGAVAAELPELHVVAVRSCAVLEHQNELVLAPVEGAHPGVVLDPDTEIF